MSGAGMSLFSAAVLLLLLPFALRGKKEQGDHSLAVNVLLLAGIEVLDVLACAHWHNAPVLLKRSVMALEALLPASLIAYGLSFARQEPLRLASRRGAALLGGALLLPGVVLLFPAYLFSTAAFASDRTVLLHAAGYWFYLGLILSCVIALVNIEATFSSTSGSDRWKIKFEVLGMGTMLVALILYYSQGLLHHSLSPELLPLRGAVLAAGSCLVLATRAFRRSGVRVAVSRYILYRSAWLLAAGAYFVILGAGAKAMEYLNISVGEHVAILLVLAAGIALAVAFLSRHIRRRIKIFVNRHFFADKHDYRQTWLDLSDRLGACTSRSELEQAIPAAYAQVFGLQSATLYFHDSRTGRYVPADKAAPQVLFQPSPRLLAHFLELNRVWNPADGEHQASEEEQAFIRASQARFVVPLLNGGQLEGLVLFGPSLASDPFTFEDYDLMKVIARQSALLLCNLRLTRELVETRELAAVARVSSFVAHDLKNLAYTLSLLMTNADLHMGNTEFQQDVLSAVRHTVDKMKQLIQKLKTLPGKGPARQQCADLRLLCEETVRDFAKARPRAFLVCRGEPVAGMVDPDELRTVIVNVMQNGLDAAGEAGTIVVETGRESGSGFIRISDNGCGMTREYQEQQLFQPFRTTKKNGLGIGLYQCRQIVASFGGFITVASEPDRGSVFTIALPAAVPVPGPVAEEQPGPGNGRAETKRERSIAGGR